MKNTIPKNILQIAFDSVSAIKHAGVTIDAAYIFGSHAKGNANKYSDIDLCIISSQFGYDRQSDRVKLMRMTDVVDLSVEPHPLSNTEFANQWDPFVKEIKTTGIRIDKNISSPFAS